METIMKLVPINQEDIDGGTLYKVGNPNQEILSIFVRRMVECIYMIEYITSSDGVPPQEVARAARYFIEGLKEGYEYGDDPITLTLCLEAADQGSELGVF